ncbi:MAG TPA: DUF445 family protein [Acidimicrobiia bacterium]|jgi:uncharacterized membrane-anchored protein YjiN (DUF445 family)|nr:DUF445 family protein [Acidimicrobiia bacterium]
MAGGGRDIKRIATALLLVMTAVFIAASLLERDYDWVVWIRVAAEAAMIGALADWFAVTALFRHPLGIPIPHTAIIPSRKDQIGLALGRFVQTSFLTKDNVLERLRGAHVAERMGIWLGDAVNVQQVAHQLTEGLAAVVASLDDEQLGPAVREVVLERIRSIHFAPMASRALTAATAEGRHQELVDAFLPAVAKALDDNQRSLLDAVISTSPWWVPRTVDEVVLEKAIEVSHRFIDEVAQRRDHPFRKRVDAFAADFARRLRDDPELISRGEELKEDLLANPAVQRYLDGLWEDTKHAVLTQADDPSSALRLRIAESIAGFGASLRTDAQLQLRVDTWLENIVGELVDRFEGEISELVTTTVERWDATETSERLEDLIGRDLQFIRINGTVVGGIAGVLIYAVSRLWA